jgi:hypothetical protein
LLRSKLMQCEHEASVDARLATLLALDRIDAHAEDSSRFRLVQSRSETRVLQFAARDIVAAFPQICR